MLTYPEESCHKDIGTGAGLATDGDGQVPREEGQPAQQEGPHYHTQGHKSLKHRQRPHSVKVFIFLVHYFPTEDHFTNFSPIVMISSYVGPLGHWPGQHKFHWQSYLVFFSPGRAPHRSSFMGAFGNNWIQLGQFRSTRLLAEIRLIMASVRAGFEMKYF